MRLRYTFRSELSKLFWPDLGHSESVFDDPILVVDYLEYFGHIRRCLSKFILDLHNQNFVTTGFNEIYVVVVNRTPKFFDPITEPRTKSGVTKDLLCSEFLVHNVILKRMDVPTELEDFLNLLLNWRYF